MSRTLQLGGESLPVSFVILVLLINAALILGVRACTPDPDPVYTDVQVDSASIVDGEPDPEVGLIESLARPRHEPTVRATAAGAARADVASFCAAAGWVLPSTAPTTGVWATTADADSIHAPSPPPAPATTGVLQRLAPVPSVVFARSGVERESSLELRLVASDGSLGHEIHDDCRLPRSWRASGDEVVVQCNRLWWVAPAVGTAAGAALLYVAATSEDELLGSGALLASGLTLGWSIAQWW